jgi:hypothetical protein
MRRIDKLLEDVDQVRYRVARLSGQELISPEFTLVALEKIFELRELVQAYLERYEQEVGEIVG